MELLILRPNSEDYHEQDAEEVIAVALDGGAGRYRRDKVNASKQVSVSWTMTPKEYEYWRAFWHTATKRGSLPFYCYLVGEDGTGPVQHVCYFVPGSVSKPSQMGLTYVQAATLEVRQNPVNDDANAVIMALFATGADEETLLDLGPLINVTAPGALA